MSIFKHTPADTKVASPETEASRKLAPPFIPPGAARATTAAGVVPPPATPMYSMQPADLPPREHEAESDGLRRATALPSMSAQRLSMAASRASALRTGFDPVAATQAGLLNLAWKWQEAGAPIRAIHTYVELLERYPHTAGAEAAVADLVELSEILTEQGQFHTALAIYDHLEALLS